MKLLLTLLLSAGMICAFMVGVRAERHYDLTRRINAVRTGDDYAEMARDMSDNDLLLHASNKAVSCPAVTDRTFVLVAVGQSNAANYVTERHASKAYAFYDGRCYAGLDPLPGATGERGSVWSRLADNILGTGRYDTVIVSAIAIGDTSVAQWAPGGILNPLIENRLQQMARAGMKPTAIIYQQGEHDATRRTDPGAYQAHARRLLAQLRGYAERVFVAPTSVCRQIKNPAIRDAQAVASFGSGAMTGVDMDRFTARVNGCHLDGATADRIAAEWRKLLEPERQAQREARVATRAAAAGGL